MKTFCLIKNRYNENGEFISYRVLGSFTSRKKALQVFQDELNTLVALDNVKIIETGSTFIVYDYYYTNSSLVSRCNVDFILFVNDGCVLDSELLTINLK